MYHHLSYSDLGAVAQTVHPLEVLHRHVVFLGDGVYGLSRLHGVGIQFAAAARLALLRCGSRFGNGVSLIHLDGCGTCHGAGGCGTVTAINLLLGITILFAAAGSGSLEVPAAWCCGGTDSCRQ